ncbi:MAG: FprA family A-type flavoprotein [Candidatus Margulisbacteria bacterium]|nr:FprA family A-type flavoprotein [Candidatus Margulisiibacteriota bacterium]
MTAKELKPNSNIFAVGAIDWDRRLFDELIPLPDGTTYNSYLVKGKDKVALLDTVDPTKTQVLLDNLKELKIDRIDYVIAHHAEQDHSGSIPAVLAAYQMAKVVTNVKCKELLKEHLLVPEEKFITINDRETLSLGDKTLEFILAPWVHWPETMFTYLKEDKILFTCDFLGSHLATSDLFAVDECRVYSSNKRYYAEIMMPFRTSIRQHLEKIKTLDIKIIATSHGPIFDKPDMILDAYKDWSSEEVRNEVVLPYVSMHGSTAEMVKYFTDALMKRGITVKPFNLSRVDIGELAMALVDAATVVIGSPTVLVGPHPLAVYAAYLANALRPKTRFVSIVGSYGWGSKMVETLSGLISNLKVEVLPPVVVKGYPKPEDFAALDSLADQILKKHQQSGVVK